MIELDREQRALLADKLGDVANLTFGALVVGQALSGRSFSAVGAIVGIVLWALCIGVAIRIRNGTL